jgi:hypothetical protein
VPVVAIVDGIKIEFYYDEHPPPHFYVKFAEFRAQVSIEALAIIRGSLPRPQLRKVIVWAQTRKPELQSTWDESRANRDPGKIA